jgi:glycosyltransferase involved in cell wall biosynthesis
MPSLNKKPLVSVLTPTWNRSGYLERVWIGLSQQTYRNFEWVVSNDGSTDDTESVIRALAGRSEFPVILINASVHIGKARMDNEAVARAQGDFILWNDSDDYLLPCAIERLVEGWNSIPVGDVGDFVGVTALCRTEDGLILSPLSTHEPFDTTWNDLAEKEGVSGDMMNLTRANELKACPFPEVDLVVPEGVTWTTLGNRKIRVQPDVVKVVEYRAPNAISFSGKQEYCRGRAYAMATSERNLRKYPRSLKTRLWRLMTFIRCSVHGEIGPKDQMRLWGENTPLFLWALLWSPAWLLALKDRLQGKVRRTHREFEAANKVVTITAQRLGHAGSEVPNGSGKPKYITKTA